MKKTFFILGAAALILFQACQKEEAANGTAGDKQSVSANIILNAAIEGAAEEGTKTTLGTENDIQYALWSKTDAVRTFDENGVYATMEIEAKDDFKPSTKATFIAKSVPGDFGEPVCAFYPASEGFNPEYADNVISFNLPATQYYKVNSFDDNTNVAVSKIQNDEGKLNAKFMNVCGYLKLQLKGDFKVGKIKVTGHNGEKLNGKFSVDLTGIDDAAAFTGAVATEDRTDGDDVITLDCTGVTGGGVQLNTETATTFDIVVPVDAFKDPDGEGNKIGGFTAVIYDVTNAPEFTVLATEKDNTIHRSKIKAMPKMTFDDNTPKFKEVEYLQATGGKKHIIYTNINAKRTVGIFVDFILKNKDHVQYIMGSFIDACRISVIKSTDYTDRFNLTFGSAERIQVAGDFDTRHSIKIVDNYGYIDTKAGAKINDKTISFTGDKPIYLFNNPSVIGGSSSSYGLIGYVYSAYITDEGVKVRDFIPCCCVSGKYTDGDGNKPAEAVTTAKPGMFDLVSGRLFINKGTSTDFTPGPYVN